MPKAINKVICPYCGKESGLNVGVGMDGSKLIYDTDTDSWCPYCHEHFALHVEIRTVYETKKLKQ